MKVIINKSLLESNITNANPYLEKKDLSSITSHILFDASEDGILSIKATDHEIGLSYKIKNAVKIESSGLATVNGSKLLSAIKGLSDDDITLETMNDWLYIKQKKSKFKLPMFDPKDFPSFPELENKNKFDINALSFSKSLRKIVNSIDNNNPKYELNGALIDIKDESINLVGTDGRKLSIFELKTPINNNTKSIIIPKKAINEIQKLFSDKIEIYYDEHTLIAISDNFEFFTKLINGNFVKYEKAIPQSVRIELNIQRDKFTQGVKAINTMCDKMRITIKKDSILFESITEDNSEAKTEIEMINDIDEEIYFGVKNRYLLDFLSSVEEPTFKILFNNSSSQVLFISENLKTILMPINL